MVDLDVDPADWAVLVRHQPLVDAILVEEVHARKASDVVIDLELGQTDRALFAILVRLADTPKPFVFMRERIRFDHFLRSAPVRTGVLDHTHEAIQAGQQARPEPDTELNFRWICEEVGLRRNMMVHVMMDVLVIVATQCVMRTVRGMQTANPERCVDHTRILHQRLVLCGRPAGDGAATLVVIVSGTPLQGTVGWRR